MAEKRFFTKGDFNANGYVPKFKTELFGDWEKTIRTLQRLSPEIKSCSVKAQLKVGNKIRDAVRAHLVNQDLGWPPLNPKYAKSKQKAQLDDRMLIAWGEYYHAINVWSSGSKHLVFIGVKSGIYTRTPSGKKSKLQVAQIAYVHEFASGRRNIRRPLWNPTIREMGGAQGIKALYIKHLWATLRRNGIPFKMLNIF